MTVPAFILGWAALIFLIVAMFNGCKLSACRVDCKRLRSQLEETRGICTGLEQALHQAQVENVRLGEQLRQAQAEQIIWLGSDACPSMDAPTHNLIERRWDERRQVFVPYWLQ